MNDLGRVANAFDTTFIDLTPTGKFVKRSAHGVNNSTMGTVLVAALITPEEIPTLQQLVVGGELLMSEVRDTWADYVNLVNVCVLKATNS
jgi:hypothetical protein